MHATVLTFPQHGHEYLVSLDPTLGPVTPGELWPSSIVTVNKMRRPNLSMLSTAFVALAITCGQGAHADAGRSPPPDVKEATRATHDARMREAIKRRIDAADESFKSMKAKKAKDESSLALMSLARRVSLTQLSEVAARCNCKVTQLHRTVGELQLAFPGLVTGKSLGESESSVTDEYKTFLEFRLNALEADRASLGTSEHDRRYWTNAEFASVSRALVELRSSGLALNGALLEGTAAAIDCAASAPSFNVLAIEPIYGTARPFAIPLETYK